nr:immunoglobulin light chain junction region [Mus musculus]NSL96972.1 immunoglobulin light chain junction region [Mus musculus]NSL96983.1 immunoglobulin light chain junction region [Mus musculus]NSL96998.1 immunoglobulin light chain junction region [Mus musculus]NSL97043.1 immunoglobulin light chain junction region [Mus musculus]
CLQSDNLPYTF